MATSVTAGAKAPAFDLQRDVLAVEHDGAKLLISLKSPEFVFVGGAIGAPATALGVDTGGGSRRFEMDYPPIPVEEIGNLEVKLFLQWFPKEAVFRKWAAYRIIDAKTTPVVAEVVMDRLDAASYKGNIIPDKFQSYPAFMKGYFAGVEYPIASTRPEGSAIVLSHKPGQKMKAGVWYETRKAVYGITPVDAEKQAFLKYVEANRPRPNGFRVVYNCWWSTEGPAGLAATESESLRLMNEFDEHLFKPLGVKFDSFIIDCGWANIGGVWEINKAYFPNGFTKFKETANKMGMSTGIWVSPSCAYGILDPKWPGLKDYETFDVPHWNDATVTDKYACLAGKNYQTRFRDVLVDLVKNTDLRHIKLDAYSYTCPNADHGHEPGDLSAEAVAEGFIGVMKAVLKASPDVWLEPTCFAPHASPWWTFYCTSVIGMYGDDMPYGRAPCPTYQESYTTARDFWNLQGAALLEYPIAAQEVMGMNHQSPDPFMNDGVITVVRGHMFLPLYLNPRYMDDAQWRMLAGLLTWARKNQSILRETLPILPASWQGGKLPRFDYAAPMPRDPYGYAHWKNGKGLIAVRNPWALPQTLALKLDETLGIQPGAKGLSAVSLYPEPRVYGKGLGFGDTLDVPLAPYETIVLSLAARQRVTGLPAVSDVIGGRIEASVSKSELKRITVEGKSSFELKLDAKVTVKAPQAKLLLLMEGDKTTPASPACTVLINGNKSRTGEKYTIEGWGEAEKHRDIAFAASSLAPVERWRFVEVPLKEGASDISVELLAGSDCSKISAWVWATKPGGEVPKYPNSLPEPEVLSVDGISLLDTTESAKIP